MVSSITGLTDGGYVVSWISSINGIYKIYLQRFDADGVRVGEETPVNVNMYASRSPSSVAKLTDGGYVIFW